jgi:hypothetical protein
MVLPSVWYSALYAHFVTKFVGVMKGKVFPRKGITAKRVISIELQFRQK